MVATTGGAVATGNTQHTTNEYSVFGPVLTDGPTTEDCTIVTNGSNLLQIYLGTTLEYSSTSAGLSMPEPFNAYLEVESNDANDGVYGEYTDYYSTTEQSGERCECAGRYTAEIVSGLTVYASAKNSGSGAGTVTLNIASH